MAKFFARSLTLTALGIMIFAAGCKKAQESSKQIIARVNDHSITVEEYRYALARLLPSAGPQDPKTAAPKEASVDDTSELKKDMLNQLIEEELMLEEAEKQKITATEEEVSKELDVIRGAYGDEQFKEVITSRYGNNIDRLKSEIKKKILVNKAIEKAIGSIIDPSGKEVRRYYDEHRKEYGSTDQVKARMIVVNSEEKAREIKKGLTAANFADTAVRESLSPEGKNGGDLGFFSKGEMPKEFEDVVFKLKPGEISPVIKTDYGYHIFFVEKKKRGGRAKYEDVKDRIFETLRNEKRDAELGIWVGSLKKDARIEIKEGLL